MNTKLMKLMCVITTILGLCITGCKDIDNEKNSENISADTGISSKYIEIVEFNNKDDELSTPEELRMSLLSYIENEYPQDKVVISLKPTEAIYLGGGDGGYVPENQEEWQNAINTVTTRLQSREQRDQWETFVPITVSWNHDGYEDVWQLCDDGSLCGWHDYGSERYTDNYIAPEDATELVSLMKEVYEKFDINPINPTKINKITSAELIIDNQSYYLEDSEKLSVLESYLKNVERIRDSRCFWYVLNLTLDNNEKIKIALAGDGCNIWYSDGVYYTSKQGESEEIFKLFGIDI